MTLIRTEFLNVSTGTVRSGSTGHGLDDEDNELPDSSGKES